MANTTAWFAPLVRAVRASVLVIAHTLLATVLIGAIALVKAILLQIGDLRLFDILPLAYLFDAMDFAILVAYVFYGVVEAVRVFRE